MKRSTAAGAPRAELSPASAANKPIQGGKAVGSEEHHTLYDRLPHLPNIHAPTKEQLLSAATSLWARFKIHFKWMTIRSFRRYTLEDVSAFISWIFIGHLVWFVVGTTTFVSLALLAVNTVSAQETLAKWIGSYLTQASGIQVVFESAIVPKWKDGVISFSNVFVSRRPGKKAQVSKGSTTTAAAAAAAAIVSGSETSSEVAVPEDDGNYTQFDITVDTIDVTLSLAKWFNGKGLVGDVCMKGIRGVIDRTSVQPTTEYVDPRSYKHEHNPGDFELDSFKMEDLLVTVYQPNNFRPFSVSVFNCELPLLRKQWLFYDFLSANSMTGAFDNSLFTIHPRQTHNYTGAKLTHGKEVDGESTEWKKHSRIRIDGLNIDHLNRGVEGPFGWIHEGNIDIVADVMLPNDTSGSVVKALSDVYDRVGAKVSQSSFLEAFPMPTLVADAGREGPSGQAQAPAVPSDSNAAHADAIDHFSEAQAVTAETHTAHPKAAAVPTNVCPPVIFDLRLTFTNLHATIPLFTSDLSYVSNALIRPIVAYINSKRHTYIPLTCRVVKPLPEFDGSWTIYDSGLVEDASREVYEAFARDVLDDERNRRRRFKKVGIWTIQLAAQALFVGLAGNIA